MRELIFVLDGFSFVFLTYFLLVSLVYIIIIGISFKRLRKFLEYVRGDVVVIGDRIKPISIIVPAYNEEETIVDNVKSLLALDYPLFEIIVVNDGSTDKTLHAIVSHFKLRRIELNVENVVPSKLIKKAYSSFEIPYLVVIDKENGGKSDALNAGINISSYPLFCALDADSILEKDALLRIVRPFLKSDDTIASGGIVRIANGCDIREGRLIEAKLPKKAVERFQVIEYFRGFLTSRVGWQQLNSLLIISGAFGLFRKSAVVEVGGYGKTIGEDMELTLRIHEHFRRKKIPYNIDFMSDAVCWTQAPQHLNDLKSQRVRWHRGMIDTMIKYRTMLFNPRYGTVGMVSVPYFWFVEMLGPVIEMIGYIMVMMYLLFGVFSEFFIVVFLMSYLFGVLFSLCGLLLEMISYQRYQRVKDIWLLIIYSFLEQFVYRQLTVWWRFTSLFNYKKGSRNWGSIKRESFTKEG